MKSVAAAINPDQANKTRFAAGKSGNPAGHAATLPKAGRPVGFKTITEALRERLARGYADKIADEVCRIAMEARSENTRVLAASWISDRVEGRPMQAMEVRQTVDESTMRVLNGLFAMAFPQSPAVIDAEIVTSKALTDGVDVI